MVERPIKKADRQLNPETNETTPSVRQSDDSDKRRSSGRDGRDGAKAREIKEAEGTRKSKLP